MRVWVGLAVCGLLVCGLSSSVLAQKKGKQPWAKKDAAPKEATQEAAAVDYGKVRWGMTAAQAKETFPGLQEAGVGRMCDKPKPKSDGTQHCFVFDTRAQLVSIEVTIAPKATTQECLVAYEHLRSLLQTTYGPYDNQDHHRTESADLGTISARASALERGILRIETVWKQSSANITMSIAQEGTKTKAVAVLAGSAMSATPQPTTSSTTTPLPEGYGKAKWGMTKAQVQKLFPKIKQQKPGLHCFTKTIANLPSNVCFQFDSAGRLGQVIILVTKRHLNSQGYIEDYEKLRDLLRAKYGPEGVANEKWTNDMFKDNPNDWGTALVMGHLGLISAWRSEVTEVGIIASGGNMSVSLAIFYNSLKLMEKLEQEKQEEDMEDL